MRLAEAQRGDHGVIIADIDHFKSINDELGHATGDQVLVEFACILQTVAANTTIVGRVGGEEFVLLVRGMPKHVSDWAIGFAGAWPDTVFPCCLQTAA